MRAIPVSYDDGRRFLVFEDGHTDPADCGAFTVHLAPDVVRVIDSERPDYPPLDLDFTYAAKVEAAASAEEVEALMRRHHAGLVAMIGEGVGAAARTIFEFTQDVKRAMR